MNFRIKYRKFKHFLKKIFNNLRFRIEAFSFPKIVILTGIILGITSLFLKQIDARESIYQFNIFNKITYFSGFLASASFIIILFLIFSLNKKEKIKKMTNIILRDYLIILVLGIVLSIMTINNYFVINGLVIFESQIFVGNGVIMMFVSSILIIVGSVLLKKDYSNKQSLFVNDSNIQDKIENKNNTKLPF